MQYRVGDKVRLKNNRSPGMDTRQGWAGTGDMNQYLGREVIISSISGMRGRSYIEDRNEIFLIKDDPKRWTFWVRDISEMIERADGLPIDAPRVKRDMSQYLRTPKEVAVIAREVYGEERVIEEKHRVIIHFPEIEISNSKEKKHTIRDLYVAVYINCYDDIEAQEDGAYVVDVHIDGVRTTFSLVEAIHKYTHSHISGGGFCQWSPFCLGSSSFGILMGSIGLEPTEPQWQLFFLALDRYVRWESIEGGPYFMIENLSYRNIIDNTTIKEELGKLIGKMPLECFDIVGPRITMKDDINTYNYFNKYSSIRSNSQMTPRSFEVLREQHLKQIEIRHKKGIQIGDKEIHFDILKEDIKSVEGVIEKAVVGQYINAFNICNINFNTIGYEREKRNQKTFREARIV